MRAQASVEMLVTFGMFIVLLLPVLMLLLVSSQYGAESSAIYQAQSSSHLVADAINDVFIQGPGAVKKVLINLPGNTDRLSVSKKEVIVILNMTGGSYSAVSPVFGNVSDSIEITEAKGLLPLLIENKKGMVEVSKDG